MPIPYLAHSEGHCSLCNLSMPLSPPMEPENNFQHNHPFPAAAANNNGNHPEFEKIMEGVDLAQILHSLNESELHELMNNPNVQIDGALPASASPATPRQRVLVKPRHNNNNNDNKNNDKSNAGLGDLAGTLVRIFLPLLILGLAFYYK